MSKAVKRRSRKPEASFSAGLYSVHGRLFSSRDEAVEYCKAERIPRFKIGLVPPPAVDLDPVKLSLREEWSLRVFLNSADPVLIFEHASETQAFKVRLFDLIDVATAVRSRMRELAKQGGAS